MKVNDMKTYQNYPYKLADVFEIYKLGGMYENMEIVHSQLNAEGFQALKELLLVADAMMHKRDFDDGYEAGYGDGRSDGYEEGYDAAHYHNYQGE